uniref:Uncharacterized protein n=1 Tax=Rhizophora mucronata TaxID=61149 RepID=A0A2P2KPN7_RHIMU
MLHMLSSVEFECQSKFMPHVPPKYSLPTFSKKTANQRTADKKNRH